MKPQQQVTLPTLHAHTFSPDPTLLRRDGSESKEAMAARLTVLEGRVRCAFWFEHSCHVNFLLFPFLSSLRFLECEMESCVRRGQYLPDPTPHQHQQGRGTAEDGPNSESRLSPTQRGPASSSQPHYGSREDGHQMRLSSAHPSSAYPSSAHPSSARPSSAHPSSAHPSSAHPSWAPAPAVAQSSEYSRGALRPSYGVTDSSVSGSSHQQQQHNDWWWQQRERERTAGLGTVRNLSAPMPSFGFLPQPMAASPPADPRDRNPKVIMVPAARRYPTVAPSYQGGSMDAPLTAVGPSSSLAPSTFPPHHPAAAYGGGQLDMAPRASMGRPRDDSSHHLLPAGTAADEGRDGPALMISGRSHLRPHQQQQAATAGYPTSNQDASRAGIVVSSAVGGGGTSDLIQNFVKRYTEAQSFLVTMRRSQEGQQSA